VLEGLLQVVGLEVMAEGVMAGHIWRGGGREFETVGAVTLEQRHQAIRLIHLPAAIVKL